MIRSRLQQAGVGRLAYQFLHRPLGALKACLKEGGPLEQRRTERGRQDMEAAALQLPVLPVRGGIPLELHMLTGRRFWYQTAFCLWTFARASGRDLAPVVLDDGSLTPDIFQPIARLFPKARLVSESEIIRRLDTHLPADGFPALRQRRQVFPLLRKLTDVHAGLSGWRLFLDSDMLFFKRPALLLDWLANPTQCLRATDVENAYGYPLELLHELAGRPVDELVNTGLLGLRSDGMDWERMEYWCRTLIERAGTHYYQEQALVALHLAGRASVAAPICDYVTFPKPPEARDCRAVMHHYVADSKRWYFQRNWRRSLASAAS